MNRRLRRLLKQLAEKDKSFYFDEGTKVEINSKTFNAGNPKRNRWYEEHKNEEFTIQYDPRYGQKPIIYELSEDTSEPKWLFSFHELSKVK